MSQCDVRTCETDPSFKIAYDCGEGEPQSITLCKPHYESYDVMPSGEKFYYFKKFAKNIEVLN